MLCSWQVPVPGFSLFTLMLFKNKLYGKIRLCSMTLSFPSSIWRFCSFGSWLMCEHSWMCDYVCRLVGEAWHLFFKLLTLRMKNACVKLSQGTSHNHLYQCLKFHVSTLLAWCLTVDAWFLTTPSPCAVSVCPYVDKHLSNSNLDPALAQHAQVAPRSLRYFFHSTLNC